MPVEISDPADPRIRLYCGLRDSALRRRVEEHHGVFVVEGTRAMRRLLASSWPVRSLLLLRERTATLGDMVAAAEHRGAPVYVACREVFDRIAGFPVHRGALALAERRPDPPIGSLLDGTQVAVLVEGVNDHENMGAIFRNAAAFGAGAVLLDPTCCDPLYRRSVRVSVGHVLRVPFTRVDPWPGALDALLGRGFTIVALDPSAAGSLDALTARRPVALMVGAEGSGLSAPALAWASQRIRIPMAADVDSLNVATAVALGLYRLRPATCA